MAVAIQTARGWPGHGIGHRHQRVRLVQRAAVQPPVQPAIRRDIAVTPVRGEHMGRAGQRREARAIQAPGPGLEGMHQLNARRQRTGRGLAKSQQGGDVHGPTARLQFVEELGQQVLRLAFELRHVAASCAPRRARTPPARRRCRAHSAENHCTSAPSPWCHRAKARCRQPSSHSHIRVRNITTAVRNRRTRGAVCAAAERARPPRRAPAASAGASSRRA